ncbi:MAG: immunoglobulin-like domain-containing protein, partial [Candidatus Paceibacterota bacterium]
NIVATGLPINTSVLGTYTIRYNVSDSQSLSAIEVTRTVIVQSAPPPPNTRPVITLTGSAVVTLTQGAVYTDQGATAQDNEDGNITANIVATGLPINTSVLGTYTIRYNVSDSQSLSAIEVTRTVIVQSAPVPPVPPPSTPPGPPGGCVGCGGGPLDIRITIFNEKVIKTNENTALVTWNTNLPATSKVAYGLNSFKNKTIDKNKEDYGYGSTTVEFTALTQSHTMLITNLLPGVKYYFRPNSDNSNSERVVGIELELPIAPVEGQCNYLLEYLQIGANNNAQEVIKLQKFLRDYEEFKDLEITGTFDQKTFDAVSQFQAKYGSDILSPWKHEEPTGFVYITTKKKINEIYCERTFPLSDTEREEIRRFTEEREKVIQEAQKEGLDVGQIIGKTEEGTKETSLAQAETQEATTTPSGVITGARNLVAGVAKISGQVIDSLGQAAEEVAKGVYKGIDSIANEFLKLFSN